jgi:hypothetical protein
VDPPSNINGVISDHEGKKGTKGQEEGKKASSAINSSFGRYEPEAQPAAEMTKGASTKYGKHEHWRGKMEVHNYILSWSTLSGQSANLKPFEAGASSENAENVLFVTEIGSWKWSRVTKGLKELVCVETCFQGTSMIHAGSSARRLKKRKEKRSKL